MKLTAAILVIGGVALAVLAASLPTGGSMLIAGISVSKEVLAGMATALAGGGSIGLLIGNLCGPSRVNR